MSVRTVFLWHLHQPEYRDPATLRPLLPWVRLHATRSYNDMAAALERHPGVKGVANWSGSLLLQLHAYAEGRSVDALEELMRKPTAELTAQERALVLADSFSVDWDLWVKPVPRYYELLVRRGLDAKALDLLHVQEGFRDHDLTDLQVHFCLAWMGFAARREEPVIAELLLKERGYTEADKQAVLEVQKRTARALLPRWQKLVERGQVEITCSPLYHPILPLLVDTDHARRALPDLPLPPRFAYPEDARLQIRRGLDEAQKAFGSRPVGMWPSEGSVSPEVVELFGAEGVRWIATDEGIVARSDVAPGPPLPGARHHHPWRAGPLTMLFRDREISDHIGFRYGKSDAHDAAEDLLRRIREAGTASGGLVTVALDGENPWEHYPRSGELFLDELYRRLADPESGVESVLPRDELQARPAQGQITRLHSGSWIESSYRIWIGHREDNAGWALLTQARGALERARAQGFDEEKLRRAQEALLPAEGSDWFWWYGDDFHTENAAEFDALFRAWIAAAWRALELPIPEAVQQPIIAAYKDRAQAAAVLLPPRRLISPLIDGFSRGFYEWLGAGLYKPGSQIGGSMHQGHGLFTQLWFGFSLQEVFLRLDPRPDAQLPTHLRLLLSREPPGGALPWERSSPTREERTLEVQLAPGGSEQPVRDSRGVACGTCRSGAIVEVSLSQLALGVAPGDKVGLSVRAMAGGVEVERLPRNGELSLDIPGRGFEHAHWQV